MTAVALAVVMVVLGAVLVTPLARRGYRRPGDTPRARHRPWWIVPAAAGVGAVLGLRDVEPALVATLGAAGLCMAALTVIDLDVHRLPDRIVAPFALGTLLMLAWSSLGVGVDAWWRALLAGGATSFAFLVLALIAPGGLGLGDVKLAFPLGALTGWFGWHAALTSAVGAFVIGGVHALALLALRRANRHTQIAFGPSMMLSALLVALFSTTPS